MVFAGIDHESRAGEGAGPVVPRCDHTHIRSRLTQGGGLLDSERPITEDGARLACEVKKDGVVPHTVASSFAASSRTRATSGRVNSTGRSWPSASSLRTAGPLHGRWTAARCRPRLVGGKP